MAAYEGIICKHDQAFLMLDGIYMLYTGEWAAIIASLMPSIFFPMTLCNSKVCPSKSNALDHNGQTWLVVRWTGLLHLEAPCIMTLTYTGLARYSFGVVRMR